MGRIKVKPLCRESSINRNDPAHMRGLFTTYSDPSALRDECPLWHV
jgi:hypothetical protein